MGKKVAVLYVSGTGNTQMMAEAIAQGAKDAGCDVQLLDMSEASADNVRDADAVALGSPAMGDEVLEEDVAQPFVDSLEGIDFSNKPVALFGSYDWGDGQWMREWVDTMKGYGATTVDSLIINLEPDDEGKEECKAFGKKLA